MTCFNEMTNACFSCSPTNSRKLYLNTTGSYFVCKEGYSEDYESYLIIYLDI